MSAIKVTLRNAEQGYCIIIPPELAIHLDARPGDLLILTPWNDKSITLETVATVAAREDACKE